MRQNWYMGFGLILLMIAMYLVMLHNGIWFLAVLAPLLLIWIYDVTQTKHAILRNFPVLGHIRFIFEFIRPEIQQYFIANNEEERPFNRETRSLVYQRAKGELDTLPFGTEKNIYSVGYTWVQHSIVPKTAALLPPKLSVGGPDCQKPYLASRLNISAMSYGALSPHALIALNQGAKLGNFAHNTGEGGISPYHLQGGDLIFQIGTGYFGCRDDKGKFCPKAFQEEALRPEVKMIEIKLSQGAKPGHGGILPKAKLTEEIAKVRKVPMGQDVISPITHSAFHTPRELLTFIASLRSLAGGKPIGFKLCLGQRHEFLGIVKAMLETHIYPDFITIDSSDGGTGAAPLEFSNYVGDPLEEGLSFVHHALLASGLRPYIRLIASGKITSGFDVLCKFSLGADLCGSARGMMLALGCIQSQQCNANTCPTGVATQDKRLQRGLVVHNKNVRVVNFHQHTLASAMELIGAMGFESPEEIRPDHIFRRISPTTVMSFAELFPALGHHALLTGDLPKNWAGWWAKASADRF